MTMEANEMLAEPEKQEELRRYLLGMVSDEERLESFEERIMADEEFSEILSMAEDDLIDDYLGDQLPADERERFSKYFLITDDRRRKFRFAEKLKSYATAVPASKESETRRPGFFSLLFMSPAFRFAVIAVLLAGSGFLFWRTFVYQSDIDRGLAELRQAYKGRRPTEARTSIAISYAPFVVTRGDGDPATDPAARDRAQLMIAAAQDPNSAAARRALGLLYLNAGEIAKAIAELESAKRLDPRRPEILIDLGAAYFESARLAERSADGARRVDALSKALAEFGDALRIDPRSRAAGFNRALALESQPLPEEAKKAWREYLKIETDPDWAAEANRHLEALESVPAKEVSADELERQVAEAVRAGEHDRAWARISANRELVRDKYLPQRLARRAAEIGQAERLELLSLLKSIGEIESERIADRFASDVADFYSRRSESELASLGAGHSALRRGYELIQGNEQKYLEASRAFRSASDTFRRLGDEPNARLADYLIGYCLINQDQSEEAIRIFDDVKDFAIARKYRWLEATVQHWVGGANIKLGRPTRGRDAYASALAVAREIGDSNAIQRNGAELAKAEYFLGNRDRALELVDVALRQLRDPEFSFRQRYRNLSSAFYVLERLGMERASAEIAVESVNVADEVLEPIFQVIARNNAAIGKLHFRDRRRAGELLEEARQIAGSIEDQNNRDRMAALTTLSSAVLARDSGDWSRAEADFDEAIGVYERLEMPSNLYEAQKGKLLMLIVAGRRAEAERFIPSVLKTTEDYRGKILDQQGQTKFFDREQSVYDISADFSVSNGNFEAAYDLVERSNSRALLDWLRSEHGASESRPRTLAEIRSEMPADSQILQFAVFETRTVVFLIDRERFVARDVSVGRDALSTLVDECLKSVMANEKASAAAGRLFELLISPVRDELEPSKTICIVPNKILFFLPFGALTDSGGSPLAMHFDHSYAPGASAFLEFAKRKSEIRDGAADAVLAVGDPAFDADRFKELPRLPAAAGEAREIAANYEPRSVLLHESATRKRFLDELGRAEIVHFAGHYVALPNSPMNSYLVLGADGADDGVLTNADLLRQRLPRTKLVVLSACRTGVEQFYNGEGMAGLARTFLAAGVPQVVASQWPVDSEATAQLMKSFHRFRTREGMTTAAALRRAQTEMANDASGRFRNPYFWAGFAVFGG